MMDDKLQKEALVDLFVLPGHLFFAALKMGKISSIFYRRVSSSALIHVPDLLKEKKSIGFSSPASPFPLLHIWLHSFV
jgi:hypothetical protein